MRNEVFSPIHPPRHLYCGKSVLLPDFNDFVTKVIGEEGVNNLCRSMA
jgi:hypothetical protein